MVKIKLFFFFIFLILQLSPVLSWSNEDTPKAEEAKGSTKKEEIYSGRQTQEWVDLLNQLNAAKAKMEAQKKVVDDLLIAKQHSVDPVKVQENVKKLTEEHKKLNDNIQEYESMRSKLRYRYPEKGVKELRVYERVEARTLNEYENSFSVDARLSQAVEMMRDKYKIKNKKTVPKDKEMQTKETQKNQEKNNPEVTDSILMVK